MQRKRIPGFSDYAADDFGRIWTKRRIGPQFKTSRGSFGNSEGPWRLMSMQFEPRGKYWTVRVGSDGALKRKRVMVHKLIALAFLGPRPDGMFISHGQGGPLDNSPSNLSYKSPAQNKADELRDGTRYSGGRHHAVVANASKWSSLLPRWEAGVERKSDLCREYGISRQCVSRRVNRDNVYKPEFAGSFEGLILGGTA